MRHLLRSRGEVTILLCIEPDLEFVCLLPVSTVSFASGAICGDGKEDDAMQLQ